MQFVHVLSDVCVRSHEPIHIVDVMKFLGGQIPLLKPFQELQSSLLQALFPMCLACYSCSPNF